jgi:hypothetical protein
LQNFCSEFWILSRINQEREGKNLWDSHYHNGSPADAPVLALCRKLTSTHPSSTPLDAYRGATLCLRVRSIGEGARLEIDGKGVGFRPLKGVPAVGTAPLVRGPST